VVELLLHIDFFMREFFSRFPLTFFLGKNMHTPGGILEGQFDNNPLEYEAYEYAVPMTYSGVNGTFVSTSPFGVDSECALGYVFIASQGDMAIYFDGPSNPSAPNVFMSQGFMGHQFKAQNVAGGILNLSPQPFWVAVKDAVTIITVNVDVKFIVTLLWRRHKDMVIPEVNHKGWGNPVG
jgi:hypothetical protein